MQLVLEKLEYKKKEVSKIEGKIEENAYMIYLKNLPEDIL
jgi:hypothetical protein